MTILDTEVIKEVPSILDPSKQYIVGIGASAGGLEAIEAFVKEIPINTGLAFVIVQHLSPDYKSLMAELLSKHTLMPVQRIEDGMLVEKNNIYLIPPRKNLTMFHDRLLLKEQVRNEGLNLPVDVFFQSLADDCNERAIGIILSGTGSDGTRGIRAIKERGGMVMVQDEESAKFNGMPSNAIATGLADFILSPNEMPTQLLAFIKHPYSGTQPPEAIANADTDVARIFALLRDKCKVDFTFYKPSTVFRRIERRVSINQLNDLSEYVRYLEVNPQEITTLYQELLIGVTSFFRDDYVYEEFKEKWLPEIITKVNEEEIRIWVSACSTGEEAYSIAMLLAEYREKTGSHFRVKIFATDIDQIAVEKASAGIYPESIVADVPSALLSKYFLRCDDNFRISQKIREMVVFAQHNLIKDPPFTNIHILSCRNVLIYLQPILQKKILELFNFSLHREGLLILGTSETIGEMVDYFEMVNPKTKFYRSKGKYKPLGLDLKMRTSLPDIHPIYNAPSYRNSRYGEDKTLDRFINALADDVLPFTLIVNEAMEVTHIFGDAKKYLVYPSGKIVTDVTKLVIKDLSIPIATGIQKCLKSNTDVSLANIRVREQQDTRTIHLCIKSLPGKKGQEKLIAILINDLNTPNLSATEENTFSYDVNKEASQRIADLDQELQFTRESLQATVEELETSNEELQATNEELLASNEELQSTNEELQSVNEELYTVNAEYQGKITELTLLNNDLDNLFNSTNIATLFLDENLDVRRFTPKLEAIFHILKSDLGRPFHHLSHSLINVDLGLLVKQVANSQKTLEQELQTQNGTWYLLRVIPYAVSESFFAGVILTFVDIDQLKVTQTLLLKQEQEEMERLTTFVHYSNDAITLQDLDQTIITWNRGAERLYGWTEKEAMQMKFSSLIPASHSKIAEKILEKIKQGEIVPEFESKRLIKSGEVIDVRVTATLLHSKGQYNEMIALTERDISKHQREAKNECVACIKQVANIVTDAAEAILLLDMNGDIFSWNQGAQMLYGWSSAEATAMNINRLLPKEHQDDFDKVIAQLLNSEKPQQTSICKRLSKDGQEIVVRVETSLLGNRNDDVLLIISREQLANRTA
jgi:two-component system, chemotaxis family, CheB/CheR fusion protein